MELNVPTKQEKKSERLTILIPTSTKDLLREMESKLGIDVPEFTRRILRKALEELKSNEAHPLRFSHPKEVPAQ